MSEIVTSADCIARTGRKYPPGYGFAIDQMPGAWENRYLLQRDAFGVVAKQFFNDMTQPGDLDVARFVVASETAKDDYGWMIECCQLIYSRIEQGKADWNIAHQIKSMLGRCGHPDFLSNYTPSPSLPGLAGLRTRSSLRMYPDDPRFKKSPLAKSA